MLRSAKRRLNNNENSNDNTTRNLIDYLSDTIGNYLRHSQWDIQFRGTYPLDAMGERIMIPLWLATIIVLGGVVGIILFILLVCYGFIGILKLKDRRRK